jgi:hypothetical protein
MAKMAKMAIRTGIRKTVIKDRKWQGIMNEASFNRKLTRLRNAEARARRLREELNAAQTTWQRNYDKLRGTPLWIAHRTEQGLDLEYNFNDIFNLSQVGTDRS